MWSVVIGSNAKTHEKYKVMRPVQCHFHEISIFKTLVELATDSYQNSWKMN